MTNKHRIGATFSTAIEIVGGATVDDVLSVEAVMRRVKMRADGSFSFVATSEPINVTISPRAASADMGEGWNFLLSASQTDDLAPGFYAMDVKFTLSDSVVLTEISSLYEMTKGVVS